MTGEAEFTAGNKKYPDAAEKITMTPAKVTLSGTGHAYSEIRTYLPGQTWIKVKVTRGDKTYEQTEETWVSELPKNPQQ